MSAPNSKENSLDLFVSEDALIGSARRCEFAMELLSIMAEHEEGSGDSEASIAESLAVFLATTAYLCADFNIPELKMLSDLKRLRKKFMTIKRKLGPRATARDAFTEIAVMDLPDDKPKSKPKASKKAVRK